MPLNYDPLDVSRKEIRLVTIEPSHGQDTQLDLSMETVSLLDDPNFEALSYCWGSSDGIDRIYINDIEAEIRSNLMAALCQFGKASKPIKNWIDSLCINQGDMLERSQQVSMMGDIYRQASNVRIWLGTDTDDVERGLRHLQEAASAGYTYLDVLDWSSSTRVPPSTDLEHWKALNKVFDNDYWRRRWILQEIVLARSISFHCDPHTIQCVGRGPEILLRLHYYASVFCQITIRSSREPFHDQRYNEMKRFSSKVRESTLQFMIGSARHLGDLSDTVLSQLFSAEASDEHDYVYGMLALFPKDFPVVPDYSVSSQVALEQFAFHFMQYYGSLRMLQFAGGATTTDDLPSWVPDLRKQMIRRHPLDVDGQEQSTETKQFLDWYYAAERLARDHHTYLTRVEELFNTSGGAELYLSRPSQGVLQLRGILVDRISTIRNSQIVALQSNHKDFQDHLDALFHGNDSDSEAEALISAYCAGLFPSSWDSMGRRIVDKDIPVLVAVLSNEDGTPFQHLDATQARLYLAQIGSVRMALTLFVTDHGRLGRGSNSIRPGDVIVVVAGCNLPMCLRPVEGELRNAFKLVGTAYVHGIMDGESVPSSEQDLLSLSSGAWEDIHLL